MMSNILWFASTPPSIASSITCYKQNIIQQGIYIYIFLTEREVLELLKIKLFFFFQKTHLYVHLTFVTLQTLHYC